MFRSLPALAALSLAGCVVGGYGPEGSSPPRHEFQTIERQPLEHLRVTLNMGVGDLQAGSGTEKLLAADFTYGIPSWQPKVRFHAAAGKGDLTIEQPDQGKGGHIGNPRYEWDLRLARNIPMDLAVHFGAGKAQLDLGSLDLQNVEVHMGVGELKMDLRGNPKHDYSVSIHGGVGEATVRLGADYGVVAECEGGIGSIEAPGMKHEGNRYQNEAYGTAKTTVHLDIHGGIGSIRLISD